MNTYGDAASAAAMQRTLLIGAALQAAGAWAPPPFHSSGPAGASKLTRSAIGHVADIAMCGILAVSGAQKSKEAIKLETLTLQRLIRHRGPDGSGIHVMENSDGSVSAIAHERLAIMDPLSGNQPLYSKDSKLSMAVNGEIYNYKELRAEIGDESRFYSPRRRRSSTRSTPGFTG